MPFDQNGLFYFGMPDGATPCGCAACTPDFEPGDIVVLLSGGPPLTVLAVCEDCGDVEVAWFRGDDKLRMQTFPSEALRPFEVN